MKLRRTALRGRIVFETTLARSETHGFDASMDGCCGFPCAGSSRVGSCWRRWPRGAREIFSQQGRSGLPVVRVVIRYGGQRDVEATRLVHLGRFVAVCAGSLGGTRLHFLPSSCIHCGPAFHSVVFDFHDFPWRRAGTVSDTQQ